MMRLFNFLLLFFTLNAHATMTLPSQKGNVAYLLNQAQVAFKGVCLEQKIEKGKVPVHIYSFEIKEVLKGDLIVGQIYEVRQSAVRNRQEAAKFNLLGVPAFRFQEGQEYLLYLGEPKVHGIRPVLGGVRRLSE